MLSCALCALRRRRCHPARPSPSVRPSPKRKHTGFLQYSASIRSATILRGFDPGAKPPSVRPSVRPSVTVRARTAHPSAITHSLPKFARMPRHGHSLDVRHLSIRTYALGVRLIVFSPLYVACRLCIGKYKLSKIVGHPRSGGRGTTTRTQRGCCYSGVGGLSCSTHATQA